MTILHLHNRSRSLDLLRRDLLHVITDVTEGLYFSSSIFLADKEAEKEILAAFCPEKANKATDVAIAHLAKLFVQCNKWLPVLDQRGPETYWAVVASTTSQIEGITLSAAHAKDLAFSFLRARKRWILRQINPESAGSNVKSHLIAGVQRLLQRFEERDKTPNAPNWQKDQEWKLTEREIRDTNGRLMGPGSQMSRGRIGLSFHSPQSLYPIGQLSGAPFLETNLLGMVDRCTEKITPAEAVQALLSDHTQEVMVAEQRADEEKALKEASQRVVQERADRDDDAGSVSSISPRNILGRVIPESVKSRFRPAWVKSPDSTKTAGRGIAERPKQAQTADTPAKVDSSSTKKRFLSEDTIVPTKKQVVAKGKARSVSNPVARKPGKSVQAGRSRSTSLQFPKPSKN